MIDVAATLPPFLRDENPGHDRFHEAVELFGLFDYLRQQGIGVFSIRESLQAVGECRDGTLQGFHLSDEEAWEAVVFMASLGVGVIELPAYPANPYGQAANRRLIERAHADGLVVSFAAHARCIEEDIAAALAAGFGRLHLYIGVSRIKQATMRLGPTELAERAFASIRYAYANGATCVRISTEDAFRTTLSDYEAFYQRLHECLSASGLRVDGIGIPDTVGVSTIDEMGDRIAVLRRVGIPFSFLECHIHNDIGTADRMYVDTLLLCQRLGIPMLPDFSILGIGERNGTIGLSSLLESIYRRLIQLYPRKMSQIREAMREKLGTLPSGELFVNRYRDMDAFFYKILSRTGFVFDRSPFSANTEFDGSGVHADTTRRAYELAIHEGRSGQTAIDIGNSAYAGALPPYDMPLRTPVLACFGCGKSNVRFWRERQQLHLRPHPEIHANLRDLEGLDDGIVPAQITESEADDLAARLIRYHSVRFNGISHHEALELIKIFYQ
ncbi:MAG: hypothetical protein Fur005_42200 [Roseiflexaceae bacterium]